MNAIRVETTVEADGELHLTQLPCQRGDRVEAIVLILEPVRQPPARSHAAFLNGYSPEDEGLYDDYPAR